MSAPKGNQNAKLPQKKFVADMECLCRTSAAEYLGMSASVLNNTIRLTKAGKAVVPLKFIQYCDNAPIWFPIIWLKKYVEDIAEASIGKRKTKF